MNLKVFFLYLCLTITSAKSDSDSSHASHAHQIKNNNFFQILSALIRVKPKIINTSNNSIHITYQKNNVTVACKHIIQNETIELMYHLLPTLKNKKQYDFPQDFMVEVPAKWIPQHSSKRLDQIAFLGSHNCYTNPQEGFLYYQQSHSTLDQFIDGGVRMLRPAWHNPSGSFLEKPNLEPILCHSSDSNCKTVSLLTRGFRPHEVVTTFNKRVVKLLQKYPQEIIIVGLNNFLKEKTDKEIEKVPELKNFIVTEDMINNKKNQQEWKGLWPTKEWMLHNNKRLIIFNDQESSDYTLSYKELVKMNEYGITSIPVAAHQRASQKDVDLDHALIEISWFQNISLPLHDLENNALFSTIELFTDIMNKVPNIFSHALKLPRNVLNFFGFKSNSANYFVYFTDTLKAARNKAHYLLSLGMPKSLVETVKKNYQSVQNMIQEVNNYIPVKQDNSLQTLLDLIRECRKTQFLTKDKIPNILMLDFATTAGDGIIAVNLINMLMDQKLKLNFVNVGGFCYKKELIDTNNII